MSLDRLCFIIVEREKANALRLKNLFRYYHASKKLDRIHKIKEPHPLKKPEVLTLHNDIKVYHANYRRIADLMNAQRAMMRKLRKETGATPKYNSRNCCTHLELDGYSLSLEQIRARHASYVFDKVALEEKDLSNPYASELYETEEKR